MRASENDAGQTGQDAVGWLDECSKPCPARLDTRLPAGGCVVARYFDVGMSRSLPWRRRPQAAALLAALTNPDRGFDSVVIGEPQRAFYGNQYGLTMPVFTDYGVRLWAPEVGGAIDPDSEAHDRS